MKKLFLPFVLMLFFFTANAQSREQIFYYYKGEKVYYPVSYDRLIIELAPGKSFVEHKKSIAKLIAVSEDSLQEISFSNQVLVKIGKNARKKEAFSSVTKLKGSSEVLYARPVIKSPSGKYVSYGREFIVKLKKSTPFARVQELMDKTGSTLVKKYPFQNDIYILAAGKQGGYDGLAMANLFYESQLFDYAEPNKSTYDVKASVTPNDSLYYLQWAHHNTGSPAQFNGTPGVDMKIQQAWDITMGNPNIKIAVIDEGVDLTHPDLQANLLQGFNGLTMTSNPGDGGYIYPTDAHGTWCAGIIAAIANNGIGVAGVAPNCKIIPAVALYNNTITDVSAAACFDYVRLQGADVISNSWIWYAETSAIDDAIDRAVTLGRGGKGCVVFFASGNDNGSLGPQASRPQVISVGGISMCGERKSPTSCDGVAFWPGANYGPGLDVVAPCVAIPGTDIQGADGYNTNSGTTGDYLDYGSGTSAACPAAAGVMALILSVDSTLTVSQATRILELSCTKLPLYNYAPAPDPNQPNGTWNNETGHGLVNAYAALQLAANPDTLPYCFVQIGSPDTLLFSVPIGLPLDTLIFNSPILLSVYNADSTATYEWRRDNTVVGSGLTYMASLPGRYDAMQTKTNCSATSNILHLIKDDAYCFVQLESADSLLCSSAIVLSVIKADSTATYEWYRDNTLVGNGPTYDAILPGKYNVIETKANCSAPSSIFNIISYVSVAATASNTTVCIPGSSVLTASAQTFETSYCTPDYAIGTVEGDFISYVSIDSTTLNNPSEGASSPFYTLYPPSGATTANLSGNTTYTMAVAGGFFIDCFIRGWIDYNQDGFFSASESIGVSNNVGALDTGSIIFNVPANAYNGVTRLRLLTEWEAPGPGVRDACLISDYGETEDYIITITNGVPNVITYSWTESSGGTTLQGNNTAEVYVSNINQTTTYTVTATTAEGCTSTSTTTISATPVATLSLESTNTTCGNNDGKVAVSVSGGSPVSGYLWSNGMTTQNLLNVPGGIYSVTATDENGCEIIDSAIVIALINPTVDLGADISFPQGQQALLDATGTGLTYLWSTGETTPTITVTTMGTYSVTVTNSSNCTASDTILVSVTTSTSDEDNTFKITVSPIPAQEIIYIRCEGSSTTSIELMDNLGRLVLKDNSFAPDGAIRTLKVDEIPSGTYHLKVSGKDFSRTVSIIKQ
jgi:subtilisin family serine protease